MQAVDSGVLRGREERVSVGFRVQKLLAWLRGCRGLFRVRRLVGFPGPGVRESVSLSIGQWVP